MGEFSGSEPLVGEVVGLRTFRVDESGLLLPLYSGGAWYDGPNTAVCAPPTGHHPRGPHLVPADDCECGFYAYGSLAAAARTRNARYVLGVVSCWGGVVAGTRGLRAEHARVDALWISKRAPQWLRHRVASRYPSAQLYAERSAMLAEHPPTPLSCYSAPGAHRRLPAAAAALAGAALLVLGLLPFATLHASTALWGLWLVTVSAAAVLTGWLLVGAHGAGHLAAAFVVAGVLAWLIAPAFGLAGWLLRVPLLRGVAVAVGSYLIGLRPHHFPVVRTPRERAFCGVRP
ncbi:MAG TPA: hypothetical protein VE442_12070 [Jatrophihabitans sp.]|jgi:hypothetical protein|nr:hypothetical protein [Jatrophihabitans sp.]